VVGVGINQGHCQTSPPGTADQPLLGGLALFIFFFQFPGHEIGKFSFVKASNQFNE
jgi:hypothetical protein